MPVVIFHDISEVDNPQAVVNIQPTNLTPRQWAQVRTRAFKEWFGDWESDPQNASKIVDENGEPRVVYHQTNAEEYVNVETGQEWDDLSWQEKMEWDNRDDWDEYWEPQDFYTFSRKSARTTNEFDGFFFAPSYDEYHEYGERTIEAFLNIRKPAGLYDYHIDATYDNAGRKERLRLQKEGYDGVITEEDGVIYEFIAFEPNQIKSATDNIGTFDSNNPDIRFRSVEDLETIYSAVDRFTEQFKAVAPIVVIENTEQLRKLYANASQKEFDEIAKTFKEASGMYDSGINKIIIFAENSNNAYTELLHENTHAAIYKLYRSNNLDSKFEHFIKDMQRMYPDGNDLVAEYYSGDEMIDELVAYTLSTFLQSKGIDVLLSKLSSQAQQEISTILNTIGYEKGRKQHTPGYAAIFATRENSSRNSRGQGDRSVYGTIHQESSTPTLSESQMGISKNERSPQGKEPITSFRSINPGESLTDYARAVVANSPETRFRALGTTRLNKYKVEKIFGGIWIRTKKEFAKFASAVENYAFEEDGEGIAYTDNFLYAYYWNIDGQPIPYASVYLNREQSQDIVNQVNQEIKDGRKDKRAKEYFDSAVKRYELFKNSDYANDGNNSSTPNRRDNMRLGNRLLRKGGYYNNPSLYVKTQRPDNSQQLTSTPTEDRPTSFRSIAADNRTADYALDSIEQATADYADTLDTERGAIIDAITPAPGDSLRTILSTYYEIGDTTRDLSPTKNAHLFGHQSIFISSKYTTQAITSFIYR